LSKRFLPDFISSFPSDFSYNFFTACENMLPIYFNRKSAGRQLTFRVGVRLSESSGNSQIGYG
jgi:hypothetical protein